MSVLGFAFEVTQSCNCDCSFCYNVWKQNPRYPSGTLNLAQIKALFDIALVGVPVQSVFLSGGEPLLRDDLEEIVRYCKLRKLLVGVATNGLLLSQERAKALAEAGVDLFEVTLLSAQPKTHNELCHNEYSFERACAAITNALHCKVGVRVAFVATSLNIQGVGEVADFICTLGVREMGFYRFTPTGKGLANSARLLPTKEQLSAALNILDERSSRLKIKVSIGIPIEPCLLQKKPLHIPFTRCQAGKRKFTIDSVGNLRLCEQDSRILGNLFQQNVAMVLLKERIRSIRTPLPDKCRRCAQRYLCRGGCKFLCA